MNLKTHTSIIGVTGGSGHLGTCLIQLLLDQGYTVKALYRSYRPPIAHDLLTWFKGNLLQPVALDPFFEGCTTVIHCASLISIGQNNKEKLLEINVDGTQHIIDKCLEFNTKLIYISSSNAVKETEEHEIFDEKRPYKTAKDFAYGYSKALAEQLVLQAVSSSPLDAFVLRPTAIVGPPDFRPSLFGKTIFEMSKGKLPAITNGGYTIVDVRDLSQTIINSLELGVRGEIYLVSGPYRSLKQIAALVRPTQAPRVFSVNVLLVLLPLLKGYQFFFKTHWPISKESLLVVKRAPRLLDTSKAETELQHQNRPITATLEDVLSWFHNNKPI